MYSYYAAFVWEVNRIMYVTHCGMSSIDYLYE